MDADQAEAIFKTGPLYVASKASVPSRVAMWQNFRDAGWPVVSTWIDEAGDGETVDFADLWTRISQEVAMCDKLVFYAEQDDFPFKGAFVEVGMALALNKPVIACLPGVELTGSTFRPVGSWIKHPLVLRVDDVVAAMGYPVG